MITQRLERQLVNLMKEDKLMFKNFANLHPPFVVFLFHKKETKTKNKY